ncbi:MAG: phosphate ABC transporter substrate-binding protein PstS [Bacteroidota bacterium]|nr:phosphate ABC transporter substrate-binding protein PstS [Bacteroidota bacterium]
MKKVLLLLALFGVVSMSSAQLQLNGAGSTFDYPIFSKWFDTYHKMTGTEINYASIGSGGGIHQVTEGTVDFGASDAPLTPEQMSDFTKAQGTDIVHIPIIMGGVAITYNLPSVGQGIKLDGTTLADIYLGKVTKWNDPRIVKMNPDKNLPDKAILVAHRSEGSGTTFIFTSYLSKVSPDWAKQCGTSIAINWPVGIGAKGTEGVAGVIAQTEGAIGYIELAYAKQNNLPYCLMKNQAGKFVEVNFNTVSAAAAGAAAHMPKDLRAVITNSPGKNSYPICGFSWVVIPKDIKNREHAQALVKFLKWGVTKGQENATSLYYAPLPKSVQKLDLEKLNAITSNGKKL